MGNVLVKRIKIQGFIIFDFYEKRYEAFAKDMSEWLDTGLIKYREQIVQGLENAPKEFTGQLEGKNFGKLVIQVNKEL